MVSPFTLQQLAVYPLAVFSGLAGSIFGDGVRLLVTLSRSVPLSGQEKRHEKPSNPAPLLAFSDSTAKKILFRLFGQTRNGFSTFAKPFKTRFAIGLQRFPKIKYCSGIICQVQPVENSLALWAYEAPSARVFPPAKPAQQAGGGSWSRMRRSRSRNTAAPCRSGNLPHGRLP